MECNQYFFHRFWTHHLVQHFLIAMLTLVLLHCKFEAKCGQNGINGHFYRLQILLLSIYRRINNKITRRTGSACLLLIFSSFSCFSENLSIPPCTLRPSKHFLMHLLNKAHAVYWSSSNSKNCSVHDYKNLFFSYSVCNLFLRVASRDRMMTVAYCSGCSLLSTFRQLSSCTSYGVSSKWAWAFGRVSSLTCCRLFEHVAVGHVAACSSMLQLDMLPPVRACCSRTCCRLFEHVAAGHVAACSNMLQPDSNML